ncbi:unnamed protein product [Ectocarpus sp. 8 AP-2014]
MGDVPGTKVWVGNLGSTCEERDLRDEFSKFGELNKVWVARNPPGFAFVWFADDRDATDAVREIDGRSIAGREWRVEIVSREQPPASIQPREKRISRPHACCPRCSFVLVVAVCHCFGRHATTAAVVVSRALRVCCCGVRVFCTPNHNTRQI